MNYKKLQALLLKRFNLPRESLIRKIIRRFTLAEKAVFYSLVAFFIISGALLAYRVNAEFLMEVPIKGGTLNEGVMGNPRFINPVLAISEADKNLTNLVYSGLVRITPEGTVENDLADSLEISRGGLLYTIHIREDAVFHDDRPVTVDDVVFTIQKIVDPNIKSPRRGNWDGVIVEKLDEYTLTLTLKKAYAPFIENLTLGILPKHIWKNVSSDEFSFSQYNTLPIGSGPYKIVSVERNSGGIPNFYHLAPFEQAYGKTPYIANLNFKFFPNEEDLFNAFLSGQIDSLGSLSPERADSLDGKVEITTSPLSRIFAVFINQTKSKVLADKTVRRALNLSAPRESIVEDVLHGYATPIDGPLPAGLFSWNTYEAEKSYEERFREAEELLSDAGWERSEETNILEKKSGSSRMSLSFSISTGDAPELRATANELAIAWRKLGAEVDILVFETGDLNQNVIRPRDFEALLFGEVVSRDADVYPFWHSSQRSDPGLNIALYANSRVDKYLEKARSADDPNVIEKNYKAFEEEVTSDLPAIFLYTPSFLYILPESVKSVSLGLLSTPQDRFAGIRDWYIDTDKVWKIFAE